MRKEQIFNHTSMRNCSATAATAKSHDQGFSLTDLLQKIFFQTPAVPA